MPNLLDGFSLRPDGMALEQTVLALGIGLGIVHIACQSLSSLFQRGGKWAAGTRDDTPVASILTGRFERASRNFQETFPLFLALVVLISLTNRSGAVSQWGAMAWLVGRTVYLPAYATGSGIRPFAFILSLIGLLAMLIHLFL